MNDAPAAPVADAGIPQQGATLLNQVAPAAPAAPEAPKEGEPPKEGQKTPEVPKFDLAKLELPEGFTIADDQKALLGEVATKHGLTNEAIKDLAALQQKTLQSKAAEPYKLWQDTQSQWQEAVKGDKDIGGDKLPATLQTVSKALDQFGTPGVRAALDFTGAGNNPEIVRTIYNMAKALGEGQYVGGNPPNQSSAPRTAAEAIYPNLKG